MSQTRLDRWYKPTIPVKKEKIVKHHWFRIIGTLLLIGVAFPTLPKSQAIQTTQSPGPYARIAIMRALDGHSVDWEAGYVRHLEWHQ